MWLHQRVIPGRISLWLSSKTAQQSTCVPTVRMNPCRCSHFTLVLSALSPFTTIDQFFIPVPVFSRAWKLTLLETRRNPVSDPCSVWELKHELFTLSGASHFHLSAKSSVFLSVGVHVRPVWWLLPGYPHQQISHRLHHTWSRTRYVTIVMQETQKLTLLSSHRFNIFDLDYF